MRTFQVKNKNDLTNYGLVLAASHAQAVENIAELESIPVDCLMASELENQHFAESGAWVDIEITFPSGFYIVTLYEPSGNVAKRLKHDCISAAAATWREYVTKAESWN